MSQSPGPDWPTDELRPALQRWGFRILRRERVRGGKAPWAAPVQPLRGPRPFDPHATWTETEYTLRRDLCCERCGRPFGYNLEVSQVSRQHAAGRSTDGSLRRELARQLRRRVRCPHCRAVQREPRRTLRRNDLRQLLLLLGMLTGGLVLVGLLAALGMWLLDRLPAPVGAAQVGAVLGALLGVMVVVVAWFWILPDLIRGEDEL